MTKKQLEALSPLLDEAVAAAKSKTNITYNPSVSEADLGHRTQLTAFTFSVGDYRHVLVMDSQGNLIHRTSSSLHMW